LLKQGISLSDRIKPLEKGDGVVKEKKYERTYENQMADGR
jgi:hypothetical protein